MVEFSDSSVNALGSVSKEFEACFKGIREEMDDHLEAINSNTNEIMSNYEYLCQLDSRLSKVEEKLDELLLAAGIHSSSKYHDFKAPRLTKSEQELYEFLLKADKPVACRELAFRLALTQTLLAEYLTALIEKGIPVGKRYSGSDILVSLDARFQHEMLARQQLKKLNVI
ncbi:hypothetical protein HYV81_06255 [Candidatus Woesearchaeota archaeon]|nr:hypothetical protein [Candidatus Woesearchaeota archaeon]